MRRLSGWLLASGMMACLAGSAWAADEALMNDTLKTIFSRKSIRSYKDEPVSKEKLRDAHQSGDGSAHGSGQEALGIHRNHGTGRS